MRKALLLTGVFALVLAGACAASGSEPVDEDCPCLQGEASGTGIPGILPEATSSKQLEWVCETYRRVVCIDYDTEPYAWCAIACGAACGACSAAGDPLLIASCYAICLPGCTAGCPECEYCSHYELEETVVCGWVLVE